MTFAPRLIVFDCDGTLVDSQHLIAEAMRLAFEGANLAPPSRAQILRTVGLSVPDALAHLAPESNAEALREMAIAFRDLCQTLRRQPRMQEPMFKGAARLLFDLASRDDAILGVATGKSRRGVIRFIEHNNLNGVFATLQTADDAPSKPHPSMLFQAMQETGVSPQNTIMIGDSTYDMIMAARAGAMGIGVGWGYHSLAELKKAGARATVNSFAELAQALAGEGALTSGAAAAA